MKCLDLHIDVLIPGGSNYKHLQNDFLFISHQVNGEVNVEILVSSNSSFYKIMESWVIPCSFVLNKKKPQLTFNIYSASPRHRNSSIILGFTVKLYAGIHT